MLFDSRRSDVSGYLEFIWRTDVPHPDDIQPRDVAVITDMYSTPWRRWYCGSYGIHTVEGPNVAYVKAELIALMEAGQ